MVRFGELRLKTLGVTLPQGMAPASCEVQFAGASRAASLPNRRKGGAGTFGEEICLQPDASLMVTLVLTRSA